MYLNESASFVGNSLLLLPTMLSSVLEQPCPDLTLLHLSKLVVEYNLDDGKTIQYKADLETTLNSKRSCSFHTVFFNVRQCLTI